MATYKEIHGTNIEALASDPSNPVDGQVWYNTTSNVLKGFKSINAWATTNSLNTARAYLGGGGTQTSALSFGGSPEIQQTEEFSQSQNVKVIAD